jgi:cobalamin-dependent methionine synthase I
MSVVPKAKLIIIGENVNTTRRIRADSPHIVRQDRGAAYRYVGLDGTVRFLDLADVFPADPERVATERIAHIGAAIRRKDLDFLAWAIGSQVDAGAHIVDLCVDELAADPLERAAHMAWIVKAAQRVRDVHYAIDSSDPQTIRAGLEAYDFSRCAPAINSTSLEPGRDVLVAMAREYGCMIFANGSGASSMPADAAQRVENLTRCMDLMDREGIPPGHRFLDPLVFPIGAGHDYGLHYLEAVRELRARFPQAHLFGGHSNVSFGLPRRKLLNDVFLTLAVQHGCDCLMIDPIMNPPGEQLAFHHAAQLLMGKDEFAAQYLRFVRNANRAAKSAAAREPAAVPAA